MKISARVQNRAGRHAVIRALMSYTYKVAEIQNTLRAGTPVTLSDIEAVAV
jgi:hypothetical protein